MESYNGRSASLPGSSASVSWFQGRAWLGGVALRVSSLALLVDVVFVTVESGKKAVS